MNVTVRFGSVAVLKRRFRFIRFGFSDGSCGSVRGSWRSALHILEPWGIGCGATRGSTQFGSLGPEASEKGTPTRAAGEGPAARGSTEFGSLGPGACEKGTPTRAAGEGPATRRRTMFGSLGPGACEKGIPGSTQFAEFGAYPRDGCWGGARHTGTYTIREFGA